MASFNYIFLSQFFHGSDHDNEYEIIQYPQKGLHEHRNLTWGGSGHLLCLHFHSKFKHWGQLNIHKHLPLSSMMPFTIASS